MSSQYETGHAKNVANLQKLIEQVTVYTNYNPPIANLEVANLQTLYTNALAKLNTKLKKNEMPTNQLFTIDKSFLKI
ncbi:MAG: hypothetical protein WBB17_12460 [Saprospiraceae bacterium]|jgi:hypothetical protein